MGWDATVGAFSEGTIVVKFRSTAGIIGSPSGSAGAGRSNSLVGRPCVGRGPKGMDETEGIDTSRSALIGLTFAV